MIDPDEFCQESELGEQTEKPSERRRGLPVPEGRLCWGEWQREMWTHMAVGATESHAAGTRRVCLGGPRGDLLTVVENFYC